MTEETIFAEALKREDRGERQAYLDASVHDDALRRRVEALLASHEGPDEFLRRPALKQLAGCDSDQGTPPGTRTSAEESADPRRGMESVLHLLEPARRAGSLGRLNHYEVMQGVGQGGFGTVLKVFDEKLHRVVAIKVLASELAASGVARQRFLQEARAAAGIRHEHVIDIHAVDDRPVPYLVMEYVDGQTLQEKLDRTGALPIKEILRIGLQMAEGLAAAHKQGVIHRDIKPSNILLENGIEKVKISDFGLARREVGDAGLTQSGLIAGTPLYMSPEQAEGRPLDQRSDLFSLGSVLYALCCGRPPFRAESTLAILRRVVDEMPRPLCECNPEVPEWLSDIIAKLLAKKPAERIQSARELADLLSVRLARLHTGEPTETRTVKMPAPIPGKRVTRRLRLGVAGVCLGLACSLIFGIWQVWPTSDHHADDPAAIAGKPNPLDRFRRDDIPRKMLALAGAGDAENAPAEIVAILGNAEAPRACVECRRLQSRRSDARRRRRRPCHPRLGSGHAVDAGSQGAHRGSRIARFQPGRQAARLGQSRHHHHALGFGRGEGSGARWRAAARGLGGWRSAPMARRWRPEAKMAGSDFGMSPRGSRASRYSPMPTPR